MNKEINAEALTISDSEFRTVENNGRIIKHAEFGTQNLDSTHHIKMFIDNDLESFWLEWHHAVAISRMPIFNDAMTRIEIHRGNWILYEHNNFEGRPLALAPGSFNLAEEGFNDMLSSFKAV